MGVIGGLIGGGIGFAASGGNPAGAAAGYGIGNSLGNALGGNSDQRGARYADINRDNFNVPGYDQTYNQYNQMINGQHAGPTSQYDAQQSALGQQLMLEAQGKGVGQAMIRKNLQQGQANLANQQLSQAASARPGMGALMARSAAQNTALGQSQMGGQAALAGSNLQLNAMGQYKNFLQDARGMDLETQMRMYGINDQRQLELLRQRLQLQGMQQQGGMGYENNRLGMYGASQQQPTNQEQLLGAIGGGLQAYSMYKNGGGDGYQPSAGYGSASNSGGSAGPRC